MREAIRPALAACVALLAASCRAPDPKQVLRLSDMETHWAIDRARGETQFLAPVIRFRLTNVGQEPLRSVQASCSFRRDGEEETWGSGFDYVATPRTPLQPGETREVVLQSDARYSSTGPPEQMMGSPAFKDVAARIFLKVASSPPVDFGGMAVERRIGARSVQEILAASPDIVLPTPPASPLPSAAASSPSGAP